MNTAEKQSGGLGKDIIIYLCLLGMAGLQIVLAYTGSAGEGLFARLLVVAAVQALVAVLFFMHLSSERRSLVVFIAVFTLFVLATMQYGWTDSFRMINGAPFAH
ncbi:MAG: cytochrome C oxidase subunit IV family protein [Acidobacteriia bacterium]|nr:cytochrome C oxidase subunit IV family protein [Terriglobia bacterium]